VLTRNAKSALRVSLLEFLDILVPCVFVTSAVGTGSPWGPGAVSAVVGTRAASSCLDLPLSAVTGPGVSKVFRRKGRGVLAGVCALHEDILLSL
jgi:hypothetical protein